MQTLKFDNQLIWFDESVISQEQVKFAFDASYWQKQGRVIGSAVGRGTTWFVELDSIQVALRHYRRGGLLGKLVEDSYVYLGSENSRSYQELELLRKLRGAGVNVPRPIAARMVKHTFTYKADLISEKIHNAKDLSEILKSNCIDSDLYSAIGRQIAIMHNENVNHTDLNIHNILIDEGDTVWLIDFDKCYIQSGEKWKERNLNRLLRSFRKELEKSSIHWEERHFDYIVSGYQETIDF
ncbi:3-deoxy-D-manno-octulosonic acid kinase [Vibrio owensii]|uniref:3-deoxy-D-manno-octulosonic acid kinase n=1 Tax=Vibrio owensii TaxID=696485 RepID=UPI0003A080FB|nr:3-deoxy-D-manno-octulosonic acid kinase [Vibrio owensii]